MYIFCHMKNPVTDGLLGLAVADALGVPVEFKSRAQLKLNPVKGMQGFGTYNQPPGTWSDDTSLPCCLAESLLNGFNLATMANRFINWCNYAYWTAHNEVFEIGNTTSHSIDKLESIIQNRKLDQLSKLHIGASDRTNGNGSLMRILPLYAYVKYLDPKAQFIATWEASALTHGHVRAAFACWLYLRLVDYLVKGIDKKAAYKQMQQDGIAYADFLKTEAEIDIFDRILQIDIIKLPEDQISSDGYVIHSLEASLWCLLRNDSYADTVLAAVNLGHDTDTTAAIVGALAGVLYGAESIPEAWLAVLARREDIAALGEKLWAKYG
jgi:ADP-ribosylglycohydrolase